MVSLEHTSADLVVLVDEEGHECGVAPRLGVHTESTPLHRAFSIHLFNERREVLITRRALHKLTWPGVWTNSCCGHPQPGEDLREAVRRRVAEELGAEIECLELALPDFRYRAVDGSGIVENELCPVFLGAVRGDRLSPDPDEVMDFAWTPWQNFHRSIRQTPQVFSPWSVLQVDQVDRLLDAFLPAATTLTRSPLERTLDDVRQLLAVQAEEIDQLWQASHPGRADLIAEAPGDLPRWFAELVTAGGKWLRPSLCHWGFIAAGGAPSGRGREAMVRAGAALEALHLFALVHDDVMDRSDQRRGRPSAHRVLAERHRAHGGCDDPDRFGDNMAILLGDLAHLSADRLAGGLPEPLRALWWELGVELLAGQRADLTGAAAGRRDREHAERVAELKSGSYSVQRPLQLGAVAAGAEPEVVGLLHRFGHHLGRAFAWRDDVLGVWGEPATTGKPAGDDLREGKATILLALGAERLSGEAARALERTRSQGAGEQDVALLQDALAEAGVRAEVEQLIADEAEQARELLRAPLGAEGIEGLAAMVDEIAWREA